MSQISEDWARQFGPGSTVVWPAGIPAAYNQGVNGVVHRQPGSLGYVDLGWALLLDLHYAAVRNRAGNFVKAEHQNVAAAAEPIQLPFTKIPSIVNSTVANAYPITALVCVVMDSSQLQSTQGKSIVDFVKWSLDRERHPRSWYAGLPSDLLPATRNELDKLYK